MRRCSALFAIVQGLTWNGRIYWVRPAHVSTNSWSVGGPFLSHSHLAAYLNMGLGLALGLLLQGNWRDFLRRDSTKLWTAYAAAIIAVGVIGSHSRSGFLGLLAASLLLACFLRRRLIPLGFGLAVVLVMIGLCLALLGGSSSVWFPSGDHPRRRQRGLLDSTRSMAGSATGLVGSTLLGVRFRSFSRRDHPLFETQ